ncbi:MAG: DUF620 domain-containing protein [Phycisphaerae bacterium]|nr:DUF620 domain-containing protein [Phycisphaerae bacterium]
MAANTWRRWMMSAAAVATLAGAGLAQPADKPADKPAEKPAAPAANLPKAADILNTYIEKTGGKAAYEKIKSRSVKAKMKMDPMGMTATLTILQATPTKMLVQTEIEGLGAVEQGTDGTLAWEKSPMSGPRLLEGSEKATFMRQATLNSEIMWDKLYTRAETVGEDTVDGKACWKIALTTPEKDTIHQWFDKATGLMVKMSMKMQSQMGELEAESMVGDYKKVGDLLLPHSTVVKVMGITQTLTTEKIEHNTDIPADKFKAPEDIVKLAEKSKQPEKKDDAPKPQGK